MRRKRHNGVILLPILAVLALFAYILFRGSSAAVSIPSLNPSKIVEEINSNATESTVESPVLYGPYTVIRVVDGDTAMIDIDGEETRVRFIGVDTPESVNPDESKNTPEGKVASDFTKALLSNQEVYLEYDVDQYDDYSRTLAYVYLDDQKTMVQDELLKAGLATTMTIQPNSKYADRFYALQVEAREHFVGFWRTGFFGG